MKKHFPVLLGMLLAFSVSAPVLAQDEYFADTESAADGSNPVSPVKGRPYYVSPMFSYLMSDKDRGTGDGFGLSLAIGKKFTYGLHLEANSYFIQAGSDAPAGTADNGTLRLTGLGVTAIVLPLVSYPNFYGLVSVGRSRGDNLPGTIPNYGGTFFDSGIGYLHPLTQRVVLRAEARYHLDSGNKDKSGVQPKDNSEFYDGLFNIGVLIPLGPMESKLPPPAEEAPVEVVPPLDSDGDGVTDDADQCPDTPAGAVVDENGCEANGDSDGDGVPDELDECPRSPAGAKVLANGCALKGDCRTPRPGEQVDEQGCAASQAFVLKGVAFEFDSTRLTEDAKLILDEVALTLQAYPDVQVEIAGHTDSLGTDSYNLGLSERRSIAVKDYLTSKSVDAGRMTANGYGESQPMDSNDTEEGRVTNRRVELRVIDENNAAAAPEAIPTEAEPETTSTEEAEPASFE